MDPFRSPGLTSLRTRELFSDFEDAEYTTTGFVAYNTGTGSLISNPPQKSYPLTQNEFGVARFGTGGVAGGACGIRMGQNDGVCRLADVNVYLRFKMGIMSALSTASQTHVIRAGLSDGHTVEPTNGIYFRYPAPGLTSGNIYLVAKSAGSSTYLDTGVAPSLTDYDLYEMTWDGTRLRGWVNGSAPVVITTNIPNGTAHAPLFMSMALQKTTGATGIVLFGDYMYGRFDFRVNR